jgi:hypothetical protein
MLIHAHTYYLNSSRSKLIEIGANLATGNAELQLRSNTNKASISIVDFNAFVSKFDAISSYFDSPNEDSDLYFTFPSNGKIIYVAGRKRFRNKLLLIFTKDEKPVKIFLARSSFENLVEMRSLIQNRFVSINTDMPFIKQVASTLGNQFQDSNIISTDDGLLLALRILDIQFVCHQDNLNLDAEKIMFEIIHICPMLIRDFIRIDC